MKALLTAACVVLLLSLPFAPVAFVQDAYADDAGGDAGDSGDADGGDGGDPPKTHFLDKANYEASDLARAVKQSDKGATVVIKGPGKGYETEVLNLARYAPESAAKLLNKWSKPKARTALGKYKAAGKVYEELTKLRKVAERVGNREQIDRLADAQSAAVDLITILESVVIAERGR